MRLISWNVNGLRAILKKGFEDIVKEQDADFFCIQETKMQEGQAVVDLPEYREFYCYAERKGYSGTAIFAKKNLSVFNIILESMMTKEEESSLSTTISI